jgi:hypothetical protein
LGVRGLREPDKDNIASNGIMIGIWDVKRHHDDDEDDGGDGGGGGGVGGGNTNIGGMMRVEGEDPHLRSCLDPGMEVDLRLGMGMGMHMGTDMDMVMGMDPDMVRLLKTIYGWNDSDVSSHLPFPSPFPRASLASVRAGCKQKHRERQANLLSSSPFPLWPSASVAPGDR